MAEETNQIKGHIDSTRRELGENLHELEYRVKQATDWRYYVDKNPATMVSLAFAGGVLAAALIGGRSRSSSRRDDIGHPLLESSEADNGPKMSYMKERAGNKTWDAIKGAVVGVATSELKNFMNEAIPGFRQHYEKIQGENSNLPRPMPANLTV